MVMILRGVAISIRRRIKDVEDAPTLRCLQLIICMGATYSQQLRTLSSITRLMPLESNNNP